MRVGGLKEKSFDSQFLIVGDAAGQVCVSWAAKCFILIFKILKKKKKKKKKKFDPLSGHGLYPALIAAKVSF
jgi:hypothetical protein